MFNYRKTIFSLILVVLIGISFIIFTDLVNAENELGGLKEAGEGIGYSQANSEDIPVLVGNIITYVLAFIGVIFIILIALGGFDIMFSGGNEELVKRGRKRIVNGAIGVLIIFAAYLITYFVLERVSEDSGLFKIK
ncbi:MAG: hypothetical protein ABIG60_05160 [Patescibacteria group bacterium]